jgi:hypothetical protein
MAYETTKGKTRLSRHASLRYGTLTWKTISAAVPSTGNRNATANPAARNFARWRASGVVPKRAVRTSDAITAISASPQHAATKVGIAMVSRSNVRGKASADAVPCAHTSRMIHG